MCVTCTNKLNNAFFYRKQCFQAEEILKNQLIKFTFVDTQQTKNHTVFSENPSFNDVSDSNENEIYSVENTVMKPIEDIDPRKFFIYIFIHLTNNNKCSYNMVYHYLLLYLCI